MTIKKKAHRTAAFQKGVTALEYGGPTLIVEGTQAIFTTTQPKIAGDRNVVSTNNHVMVLATEMRIPPGRPAIQVTSPIGTK